MLLIFTIINIKGRLILIIHVILKTRWFILSVWVGLINKVATLVSIQFNENLSSLKIIPGNGETNQRVLTLR